MKTLRLHTLLILVFTLTLINHSNALDFERVEATVFFDFDSSELTNGAQTAVKNLFPFDADFYPEKITLTGYTDKKGDRDYNLQLSKKRAQAVKDHIQLLYISNTEFEVESLGEDQPIYGCDDNLNRCVKVIMLLREKEEPVSLARCKELFPEEFTSEPEYPEKVVEEVLEQPQLLSDDNKFQKKVVTESNNMVRLNDILFYGNSDKFYSSAKPELEELAQFLKSNPNYVVQITGHVNGGKGSSRLLKKESGFNDIYDLSLARAESVKLFLIEKGISANRITTEGKGDEEMLFPKPETADESAANRRIEITFSIPEN